MVIFLTCYSFNGHEYNWTESIMIACSTSLMFDGIEFNGTVSLKIFNSTIF